MQYVTALYVVSVMKSRIRQPAADDMLSLIWSMGDKPDSDGMGNIILVRHN